MGKFSGENPGSRFVKGRKQEALAEIEGWVGGSRDEIIKGNANSYFYPGLASWSRGSRNFSWESESKNHACRSRS